MLTPSTHRDIGTAINEIGNNGIYGKEYNINDEDFSYHSPDGFAKEEAAAHGELGHDAVRMLPTATSGSKEGATHNFVQMDITPNWLHEIGNNQMFDKAGLISALINQNFPCIACNNHKNINNPPLGFLSSFRGQALQPGSYLMLMLLTFVMNLCGMVMEVWKVYGVCITSALTRSSSNASGCPKWMQLFGKGLQVLLEMHPLASLRRLLFLKPQMMPLPQPTWFDLLSLAQPPEP